MAFYLARLHALNFRNHREAEVAARLARARTDVDDRVVRSPIDGVVDRRFVRLGEFVDAGERILLDGLGNVVVGGKCLAAGCVFKLDAATGAVAWGLPSVTTSRGSAVVAPPTRKSAAVLPGSR